MREKIKKKDEYFTRFLFAKIFKYFFQIILILIILLSIIYILIHQKF